MLRFLAIVLIIFLIGIIIIRKVRNSLENMIRQSFKSQSNDNAKDEVLYQDDDVIVLKGESNKKDD